MELVAWELSLDFMESLLIGLQKEDYKLEETYEVDLSICFLFLRLRLTLIYN